jgi:hypothetical protein
MMRGVFWDVPPCGSCKNRRFEGTQHLLYQGEKIGVLGTTLAVTSNQLTLRRNTKYCTVFYCIVLYQVLGIFRSVRRLLVRASVEEWCLLGCYAV